MRLFASVGLVVCALSACTAPDVSPIGVRARPSYEGKPRPVPGFQPFRKQMRRLRDGMSRSEAYRIMGEPQRVVNGRGAQKWRYGHPDRVQLVLTFRQGRLQGWVLGE